MRVAVPIIVLVVVALLSAVTTAIKIDAASSGSVIVATSLGMTPGGAPVDVLPGATTTVRTGDVVMAIDGRSMEGWAESLADPEAARLAIDRATASLSTSCGTARPRCSTSSRLPTRRLTCSSRPPGR
jgi:hypothetical protein